MTLPELAARIDEMADDMESVSADMDHGSAPAIHEHSVELLGAALVARGWAAGIREIAAPQTA